VIYRGLPGHGPGPDFRSAIVVLPSGLAEGDVELHVRASDFYHHGHHLDPAYDEVALHVVFVDDSPGVRGTVLSSGRTVPIATVPLPGSSRARVPYADPCRGAVTRLGAETVGAALDRLGAMRFRQKTAAFAKRLKAGEAGEEILWRSLLEALSFGGVSLAPIADALAWAVLRPHLLALAPSIRETEARALLTSHHSDPENAGRSQLPGNRPERRLEGAAALAARFAGEGLAASLLAALDEDGARDRLLTALTVPRLIGRARAVEIAANAVLPLAAALTGEPAARRYEALFAGLPLPARYGAVRHLHEAAGDAVGLSARRQQGMLYLLRQYCTQGGCGKCPLS
jgi:hypothetical protein